MTIQFVHTRQHFLPSGLRALIIASGFWALSLALTTISGSVAALAGCIAACWLIDSSLYRAPLKWLHTPALLTACLLIGGGGMLLAELLVDSNAPAVWLSPLAAFHSGEFIAWLSLAFAITCALRVLAHRTGYGAVLEIVGVATAFIITLAAHRHGMIHRPFFLGDFALTRGIDPATMLLAFGGGAVLLLAALLMMENNVRRLPWHFAVLGLLCFALVGYIRWFGLPTPGLTDDLGLTGTAAGSGSQQRDNPFQDGENSAEEKTAPVAVVVFRDDYEPINGAYYFRESAYSRFDGEMLDYADRDDMDRDLISGFTSDRTEARLLPGAQDQRSRVRTSIGMLVPHRNPFGLVSPVAYHSVVNPNPLRFKRTYDAYSMAPDYDFDYLLGREAGRQQWSEQVWREYLKLPDDPRYGQLAASLVARLRPEYADDPFAKAWTIKRYLDENGIYSLKNQHAYASDPAASFLFGDLTGYCTHFAFAATYLYRSLGLPARVGVGYSVPATNRAGGSALLVQAVHAHAWPEIYLQDIGWVIVDPSPQQTLVDMTTDPQNELQQLLGDMLRDDASFADFLASRQAGSFRFQTLWYGAAALMLAAILLGYGIKVWRLLVPRIGSPARRHVLSYRAALDRLAAIGQARRYGESREHFAARLAGSVPSLSRLTEAHLAVALGQRHDAPLPAAHWQTLEGRVRTEIAHSTPVWKRVLAVLNPFCWLFSR